MRLLAVCPDSRAGSVVWREYVNVTETALVFPALRKADTTYTMLASAVKEA